MLLFFCYYLRLCLSFVPFYFTSGSCCVCFFIFYSVLYLCILFMFVTFRGIYIVQFYSFFLFLIIIHFVILFLFMLLLEWAFLLPCQLVVFGLNQINSENRSERTTKQPKKNSMTLAIRRLCLQNSFRSACIYLLFVICVCVCVHIWFMRILNLAFICNFA